jgi:RND family efflux transporter MFP subunit
VLLVIAVIVLLTVAAAVAFSLRSQPAAVHLAPVTRGDLLVRVLCDGNLEPPPGGELRSAEGGTVREIAVHEGDRVRAGQLLLRVDNPQIAAALRQASGDLSRVEAERAAAAADLDRAAREAAYRRQLAEADRRLVGQSALPAATAEADELAARQAEAQASAAQAQLAAILGPAGAAKETSRLALAAAAVRDLARRDAALTVRAPFDGVVYGLPRAAGQVVDPGEMVAGVTDPDHPRLRFRIDQPDLPRIAAGQRMTVRFSGLPDRSWEGRVTAAGGGLRDVGGREVGEALGELADPARALPLNATVDVQVVVAERRGVLTIPRSALRREGDQRVVYLVAGDTVRRRAVTVGLVGLSEVEVAGGLAADDRVVADAAVPLREGQRVRTAAP